MRLIDADALIEAHYNYCNTHHGEADIFWTWSLRLMKDAPTIEPEPVRRGHWEVVDEAEPRRYSCSECKILSFYLYHYCPCCGAKMEEQEGD